MKKTTKNYVETIYTLTADEVATAIRKEVYRLKVEGAEFMGFSTEDSEILYHDDGSVSVVNRSDSPSREDPRPEVLRRSK